MFAHNFPKRFQLKTVRSWSVRYPFEEQFAQLSNPIFLENVRCYDRLRTPDKPRDRYNADIHYCVATCASCVRRKIPEWSFRRFSETKRDSIRRRPEDNAIISSLKKVGPLETASLNSKGKELWTAAFVLMQLIRVSIGIRARFCEVYSEGVRKFSGIFFSAQWIV